jgi:hypothetical protein
LPGETRLSSFLPYMLFPIIAVLLIFALLPIWSDRPASPTDEQIAAAETYLANVCVSCPVYEIVEAAK